MRSSNTISRIMSLYDRVMDAALDIEPEDKPVAKSPAAHYTGKFRRTSSGVYLQEIRGGFPELEFGK